jgi:hypothetical protein
MGADVVRNGEPIAGMSPEDAAGLEAMRRADLSTLRPERAQYG